MLKFNKQEKVTNKKKVIIKYSQCNSSYQRISVPWNGKINKVGALLSDLNAIQSFSMAHIHPWLLDYTCMAGLAPFMPHVETRQAGSAKAFTDSHYHSQPQRHCQTSVLHASNHLAKIPPLLSCPSSDFPDTISFPSLPQYIVTCHNPALCPTLITSHHITS